MKVDQNARPRREYIPTFINEGGSYAPKARFYLNEGGSYAPKARFYLNEGGSYAPKARMLLRRDST